MTIQITKRQFLRIMAGSGIALSIGNLSCFPAHPTKPVLRLSAATDEILALINAKPIDVENGQVLNDKVVLIQNGKIIDVVNKDENILAQCRKVDCYDSFLIPGLINAHCHITAPSVLKASFGDLGTLRKQVVLNYENTIGWGVTTIRDMGSMPKIMIKDREAISRGDLTGPHILTPLSFITVPNGYPDFGGRITSFVKMLIGNPYLRGATSAESVDHVKQVADKGGDFIKIAFDHRSLLYGRDRLDVLSDKQVDAIKNEATKLGMPVAAHHLFSKGLDRGLQFGIDSMEHVMGDAKISDEQIRNILDTKTPLVPTLTVGVNMSFKTTGDPYNEDTLLNEMLKWRQDEVMPELPSHCSPRIMEMTHEIIRYFENEEYALKKNRKVLSYNPKVATRGVVAGIKNLKRLIKEGVRLGVGNDSGVPLIFPGMIHHEMELLCRFGMSTKQALRAATLTNAEILKIDDRTGSISKGKRADIAFLAENPLEDIKNVRKVLAVFKEGVLVSKAPEFSLQI